MLKHEDKLVFIKTPSFNYNVLNSVDPRMTCSSYVTIIRFHKHCRVSILEEYYSQVKK